MAGAAKHKKEKSASVEASSEAEVDSAAEAAEVAEPAVQDGGMKTVTPEGEELETQAQIEAEGDHGGGAGFPYLEDLSATPPLPQAELALPPAEAMAGAPLFSAAAYLEPSPTAGMPGSKAPVQEAKVEAKENLVALFVTEERMQDLWKRADKAKELVDAKVQSLQIARTLLDLVQSARNELMGGKDRYEEAERFINEVEFRVAQNERMRRWSHTLGITLFVYEFLWAIALGYGLLMSWTGNFDALASVDFKYGLSSMIWGGLGGVMGAWLSLVKHISVEQDFDRQHSMWYVMSPLMGVGIGAFVFLLIRSGLFLLMGANQQAITSPWVIYVLAWLSGYQHNVFTDILKRVMKVLESEAKPAAQEGEK